MSELVGIVGASGTGKSTSMGHIPELGIAGLNPEETFVINVMGKPLPFKGWKAKYEDGKNYFSTTDAKTILAALAKIKDMPNIKNIVLDDYQYVMANEFVQKATTKGFDKFAIMAKNAYDVLNTSRMLRDDQKVIVLTHSEDVMIDGKSFKKIKTIGKMLDEKVTLEGLFTVLLFTDVEYDDKAQTATYSFVTNRTDEYQAKSPVGMFDNIKIPNDLGLVVSKIDEYNHG
jgi:hypothetical protein